MLPSDNETIVDNYLEIQRLKAVLGRAIDFNDINFDEMVQTEMKDALITRKVDRVTILYENDGQAIVKVFFVSLGEAIDGEKILSKPKEHEIFFVIRKTLPP